MPRTIIYDRPRSSLPPQARPTYGERVAGTEQDGDVRPGDPYLTRLAKYIPAETLAFMVFSTSFSQETRGQTIAVVLIGAVGQLLWLYNRGQAISDPEDRPTWRYYMFSLIAYSAWIIGTCPQVSHYAGIPRTTAAIILGGVAYLLPLADPETHAWIDHREPPLITR